MDPESGSSSPSDFIAKYQKLATEYSKMRAQVIVLKKGVTDEQAKTVELRDDVKEKDQKLRKMEQEIECLNFRNQQLTKRVSILQNDLDHIEMSRSKSKTKNSPSSRSTFHNDQSLGVLDAELRNRIEENEKLHLKLQSVESDYDKIVDDLRSDLQNLKCGSAAKQKEQIEMIEQQNTALSSLRQEKVRLETKFISCQEELDKARTITLKFLGKTVTEVNEAISQDGDDFLVNQLRNRITELIDSLHAADSKGSLFHAECNRLKNRLQLAAQDKRSGEQELAGLRAETSSLRDELSTTVRNYEAQLSTMSEHLATMNEKWTSQQDEIDSMRLTMNGNMNRKTKNK